ncbi:MAG TPA: uroporphyrinogen decarboxylase family protein [Candidatus Atribacteria bacterium]|nr:uroporphyrinogen decarboxylase family protein [Candidatus Atribacteria bacterium]
MTKSAQEIAMERLARIEAAINLKEPDRVPLWGVGGDIIPAYAGITHYEFCFDYNKTREALAKFNKDFPCDWTFAAGFTGVGVPPLTYAFADHPELTIIFGMTGRTHDILGDKCTRYPGRELEENCSPQFIGGTFMEVDEYDELIRDPVGFIAETVLPRICRNLETPVKAMATWIRMGMESENVLAFMQGVNEDLAELGFPVIPLTLAMVPLDLIGDGLRDVTNALLDVRRYPEKVKQASEALMEPTLKVGLAMKPLGARIAFIPLHLNEYLSPELYNELYWPYLKRIILGFAEEGIKSLVFFEGYHDAHLETILELPEGWGIAYFEKTDIRKAKEVLKGHTCIMGGVPISLIISGTPGKIDEYVKDLMEDVKPGGGYIASTSIGIAPRDTPIENINALISAVEKYGKY